MVSAQFRRLDAAGRRGARIARTHAAPTRGSSPTTSRTAPNSDFALGDRNIAVLPHPLNVKHGRAPQLQLWGLDDDQNATLRSTSAAAGGRRVGGRVQNLPGAIPRALRAAGPLPPPRVVNVDHGSQRFLLFALDGSRAPGACTTPAMAWIDQPLSDARRRRLRMSRLGVQGRRRAGRRRRPARWHSGRACAPTASTIAGRTVLAGLQRPASSAGRLPRDHVDADRRRAGRHWLGLRLHGSDGSVEDWSEQPMNRPLRLSGQAKPACRSNRAVAIRGSPTSAVGSADTIARTARCPGPRT